MRFITAAAAAAFLVLQAALPAQACEEEASYSPAQSVSIETVLQHVAVTPAATDELSAATKKKDEYMKSAAGPEPKAKSSKSKKKKTKKSKGKSSKSKSSKAKPADKKS